MVFNGNVPPVEVNNAVANSNYDVKRAMRISQSEIKTLINDMADPTKLDIIIDGKRYAKSDTITLSLALNNKMEALQNQTSSIISVFSELYKLEKSITP
jgi:hypothetical protein